jgi:hypothetical protein
MVDHPVKISAMGEIYVIIMYSLCHFRTVDALLNKITEADMRGAMKLNEISFHLIHFISFCCRAEICLG